MTILQQKYLSLANTDIQERLFADFYEALDLLEQEEKEAFLNDENLLTVCKNYINSISYSPFLFRLFLKNLPFVRKIAVSGFDKVFENISKETFKNLYKSQSYDDVFNGLRLFKNRIALLTGLADVTGVWTLDRITGVLSLTALAALRIATAFVLRSAALKGDLALPDLNNPEENSGFIVLSMGKLGARELNYSSDIDLILLYDAEKTPYTGKRDISFFFVRLCRDLVALLEERGATGYVFRTDLRLRPDPASTPIALSTQAASFYYESFAQNWERAAFIKARAVAGDIDAGRAFLKDIKPFIWRRSTDFYVLEQIRSMKYSSGEKITNQTSLYGHNIKLAQGGIREIEFYTQLQQLLWGGRNDKLRVRSTLAALKALCSAGRISKEAKEFLSQAYVYLRTLEHRLQMREDLQTQTLPKTKNEMLEIARFFGFETIDPFERETRACLTGVQKLYDSLFEAPNNARENTTLVFTGTDLPKETQDVLEQAGFSNFSFIADTVRGWLSGRYRCMRSDKARLLLTGLLPVIFKALSKTKSPDAAFMHFDDFLHGLPSGVQLFSLFQSRPALLDLLTEIMGQSTFLAQELAHRPALFDAVLDPDFFAVPPTRESLQNDLDALLNAADGFEQILDSCRRFAREKRFQIAVFFLRGLFNAQKTGKMLSVMADLVIGALFPAVEDDFSRRFGKIKNAKTAFVLSGKGGSREMSFLSDLDILFVYDTPENAASDGDTSLAAPVYYARLAQRLVSALTSNTAEGVLWQVDMRLRPSGSAGPVATSFNSFKRYYAQNAWTWEFQALTKARVVYATNGIKDVLEKEIQTLLSQKRSLPQLADDVNSMREKMANENKPVSLWDVKTKTGGMTDIEFAAQYIQLAYAEKFPTLLQKSTLNVLNEAVSLGLAEKEKTQELIDRYALFQDITLTASLCRDENATAAKMAEKYGCQSSVEFEERFLSEKPRLKAPYETVILR